MAKLTTSNGQFAQTFTVNQKTGSYILLSTANKYLDKDVKITTNVKSAVAAANTASADAEVVTTDGSNAGINIAATANIVGTKVTTEPTSGYYIAIKATGSGSSKITTAGWIDTGALTAASTNATKYFPIATGSCTVAGGVLSTSGYTKSDLALTLSSGSETNMANITLGAKDTTNYPYYFKISGSTPAVSGNTSASVTAITDTHTAGYIPAKATTNFRAAQSASPSVSVNATSAITYIGLKKAGLTFSGGALNNKGATATFVNSNNKVISTASSDTYNNGLSVLAKGSAGRAAVTYTNTAGYLPANTSAQNASSAVSSSTWDGTTYYLTGVKLAAPSSGVAKFDITVPNGSTSEFITFQFQVDSSGNVTVLGPD